MREHLGDIIICTVHIFIFLKETISKLIMINGLLGAHTSQHTVQPVQDLLLNSGHDSMESVLP
jgi:hypothetical protein